MISVIRKYLEIEFDPEKSARNVRERGLSFEQAVDFEFETAKIIEDTRKVYSERRYLALGKLEGRVHMLVFSQPSSRIRVISFRKADRREVKRYET